MNLNRMGTCPLFLAITLLVLGCSHQVETIRVPVEVKVPIEHRVLPPEEYTAPVANPVLPTWVAPTDAAASSCLTPEGERQLKALIAAERARQEGLHGWTLKANPDAASP